MAVAAVVTAAVVNHRRAVRIHGRAVHDRGRGIVGGRRRVVAGRRRGRVARIVGGRGLVVRRGRGGRRAVVAVRRHRRTDGGADHGTHGGTGRAPGSGTDGTSDDGARE